MYYTNDTYAFYSSIGQIFTLRLSERLLPSIVRLELHPGCTERIPLSTEPFPFLEIGELISESQTLRTCWHISKDHAHPSELVLITSTILPSSLNTTKAYLAVTRWDSCA